MARDPITILHVDMDAFYASVEQRDQPELQGKPVIVGGIDGRGVVCAASYEARPFGVHSAMPMATARRLCPQAIFLPVRMKHYAEISRQIREIFFSFTPLVEPLSLDEAFLDVRGCEGLFGPAPAIARQIKERIKQETGLIASVGVAPNKFLAKLASDHGKPDGLVVLPPEQVTAFLTPLPVGRIWGVGKKAEERLHALGVRTIGQLAALPEKVLVGSLRRGRPARLAAGPWTGRTRGRARPGGQVDQHGNDVRPGHRRPGRAASLAARPGGPSGCSAAARGAACPHRGAEDPLLGFPNPAPGAWIARSYRLH